MRVCALALVAGLASTSAYAADAVFEEPPAPVVVEVPIFIWTGGYLGLQGGGLWSDNSINEPDTGVFSDNFNGGLFGAYAGYNWQSGAWVFGVEGDINGVWNDETFSINGFDVDVGSDYLASLRGRVGYAFDRALIFATGGVAFTQTSAESDIFNGVSLDADDSFDRLDGRSRRANTPSPTTGLAASNIATMTSATVRSTTSATSNSRPTPLQPVSPTSSDRNANWPGHTAPWPALP